MSLHVDVRGSGPDLVLLHGWGMHGGVWDEPFLCELEKHARLHVVDLPGHGYSGDVPAASLDEVIDCIAAVVPQNAAWLGWSLGGMIALVAASRGLVSKLGLIATSPRFIQGPQWDCALAEEVLTEFAQQLQLDPVASTKRFLAWQVLGAARPAALAKSVKALLATRPAARQASLVLGVQLLQTLDLRGVWSSLCLPTVLIYGVEDGLVPVAAVRWLHEQQTDALCEMLDAAVHVPFLTHPQQSSDAIAKWIECRVD